MSVDVLISPRISFSHDIDLSEDDSSVQCEIFPCSSSSIEVDFDFAFRVDSHGALIRESSTADELFSDGKLLPVSIDLATNTEITTNTENPNLFQSFASPVFPCFISKNGSKEEKKILKSLKEHLEDDIDTDTDIEGEESEDESTTQQATVSRTFWKFRRSSSFNVSNYGRNRGKQSTPPKLQPLSRSKSTGLPRNTVEEDSSPSLPTLMEDERSFWRLKRSNSLDCDKSGQNKVDLIGSLKVILLRSNSTSEQVFAKATATTEGARQFRIRRSSSLNCDGNNRRSRGFVMGRSYSTGSAYSEKKELLKQNSARSSSSSSSSWKKGQRQGRRRRRSFKEYYATFYRGERVNPVLNLPSPYISRASVDLLGFGSLFCNGRYSRKMSK